MKGVGEGNKPNNYNHKYNETNKMTIKIKKFFFFFFLKQHSKSASANMVVGNRFINNKMFIEYCVKLNWSKPAIHSDW